MTVAFLLSERLQTGTSCLWTQSQTISVHHWEPLNTVFCKNLSLFCIIILNPLSAKVHIFLFFSSLNSCDWLRNIIILHCLSSRNMSFSCFVSWTWATDRHQDISSRHAVMTTHAPQSMPCETLLKAYGIGGENTVCLIIKQVFTILQYL